MAQEASLTSPKISIIVPVYKVEQYLRRCLDSIVAQTFTDWECILIDDGSPDNSGAICDEYAAKDNRFHVIHQENAGVSSARNAGLDAAKGEWIGFVDSDDWIEPNMYESMILSARNNDVDVIGCDVFKEEKQGTFIKKIFLSDRGTENIENLLQGGTPGWIWNKLIKRKLIEENGISFLQGCSLCEDEIFSIKIYDRSIKTGYLEKALYHYDLTIQSSAVHIVDDAKIASLLLVNDMIKHYFSESGQMSLYKENILLKQIRNKIWLLLNYSGSNKNVKCIYNDEKLSACKQVKFQNRFFLFCCEKKWFLFVDILLFLEKIRISLKESIVCFKSIGRRKS